MVILHICLKSRYLLNPNSTARLSSCVRVSRLLSFSSSVGLPSIILSADEPSLIKHISELAASRFYFQRNNNAFRVFTTCSIDSLSPEATASSNEADLAELNGLASSRYFVESIVKVVRRDEAEMESWLDSIGKDISKCDLFETLRTLNRLGLNATRLFRWIQNGNLHVKCDAVVCSLMVDNCGRLADYQTMLTLLKDFSERKILLTDEAFSFLASVCTREEELKHSVKKLVNILEEAGGTSCKSGICALIQMCCAMNCFDAAKFVADMKKTEPLYHRVWLRECCLRGKFKEARGRLHEIKHTGCGLDTRTYNYLISCLLKCGMLDQTCNVLEQMLQSVCPPNALTYEVLICQFCKAGDLDSAVSLYYVMVSSGVKPRLSTCSAVIKAFFKAHRYEEAYSFLVRVSEEQKCLTNALYSLLANLHRKEGDLIVAYNLLMEMIEKGLKPDFAVYVNVSKKLYKRRHKDLAGLLKNLFCSLFQDSNK